SDAVSFGRGTLIEAIGTFMLVFVIFGVIDRRAVPGWAPMAIGSIVFAVIIIVGPATGAAINPARYLGPFVWQDVFGGSVEWGQVPAYLIGEFAGGVLGAFAYTALARTRSVADAVAEPARRPAEVSGVGHEEAHQRAGHRRSGGTGGRCRSAPRPRCRRREQGHHTCGRRH